MEYLAILIYPAVCIGLIILIRQYFVKKRYPNKTGSMLDSVQKLGIKGYKRTENGYEGKEGEFNVYIYASTSISQVGHMQDNLFQVWLTIAPQPGQLKGLGGFFGKYMVTGEKPGYAMIGFTLRFDTRTDATENLISMSKNLTQKLQENGVKPYIP